MNLFRSEEHARRWASFNPEYPQGLHPLAWWVERFSAPLFRERSRPDYVSWLTAWREAQRR
jgi:hypothetical protein